jgi:hypothetical protein
MRNGANGTNVRREHNVRTQERHGYFREIEVKLYSPTDKEGVCEEFTDFSETVCEVGG